MTRAVTLKTLSQLTHKDLTEYSITATLRGLQDKSAHVRRVAVLACARVHKLQPDFVEERGVIDQLYSLIRDTDPVVMVNCLHSLDEILRHDGGVVVNKKMNTYLLNRLHEVPSGLLADVVVYLQRYQPSVEQEVYDVMNICDEYLNHNSSAVVCTLARYMLWLTRDFTAVNQQVLQRIKQPLLQMTNTANPELVYTILGFIEEIYLSERTVQYISSNAATFLCKQKDPVYLKIKRMNILSRLITESNVASVLEEFYTQAKSSQNKIVSCAVMCISTVAAGNQTFLTACLQRLLSLLSMERSHLSAEIIRALAELEITSEPATMKAIMRQICKYMLANDDIQVDIEVCCLWLLGEYGQHCGSTVYVFEEYFNRFESWQNTELCTSLMSTAVKLFMNYPAQCQHVLGHVLESAYLHGNFMVKQTVKYYYSLLKNKTEAINSVVLGQ